MTNSELENRLRLLVREERRITDEILTLIREAESRKIFLDRGFPNLYEWLTQGFGYSHGAAHRRIQAARLAHAVPGVSEKLIEGGLSLSTAAALQSVVRKEERRTGVEISQERKEELVDRIEGKSSVAVQAVLVSEFPESAVQKEKVRVINAAEAKVTLVLPKEVIEALERAREILSHVLPGAGLAEVVAHLAKGFVKEQKSASDKRCVNGSRAGIRRAVFKKAGGRCEYRDPSSGRVCGSRWQVELDHKLPRALGGGDELENLRCLCRAHNQSEARRLLGLGEKTYRERVKDRTS